jgi:hypothetical protein
MKSLSTEGSGAKEGETMESLDTEGWDVKEEEEKEKYLGKAKLLKIEYEKQIKEKEKEYKIQLRKLQLEYLNAINTIKRGDIIFDGYYRICVEKIMPSLSYFGELPCCAFEGVRLTKNGNPFKTGEQARILGPNIKKVMKGYSRKDNEEKNETR